MSTCTDENLSCEEQKLGDSQLWRRLLRKVGDCIGLNVINRLSNPKASSISVPVIIEDSSPAGLSTAIDAWKTGNPDVTIVSISYAKAVNASSPGSMLYSVLIVYID